MKGGALQSVGAWIMGFHVVSDNSTNHEHGLSCSRTVDPDKALRGSLDPGHQHGFRLRHRPQTSTWSSGVTWAVGINTDPSCDRQIYSDTAFRRSTDGDITVASGECSTAPGVSTVHGHQHGIDDCRCTVEKG